MWSKLKKQFGQWRSVLIVAPCIGGLAIAAASVGVFQLVEWATLDRFFRLRPPENIDDRIVIVTIGEADIKKARQWPISDQLLAELIEKIEKQQPRVIGLALYRDLPVTPGYRELEKVFKSTPNLIGVEKVVGSSVGPPPTLDKLNRVGIADLVLDADGKVRRGLLSVKADDGKTKVSLGTKLALMYLEKEGIQLQQIDPKNKSLRLGKAVFIPLTGNEGGYVGANAGGYQILLNWRGTLEKFNYVSMTEVLENKIPPNILRDRIVSIGATGESLNDLFFTPYSSKFFQSPKRTPSVVIHANLTSQIISAALDGRSFIRVFPDSIEALWTLVWSFIGGATSFILLRKSFIYRDLIYSFSILVTSGILIGINYVMFLSNYWLPMIPPLVALTVSTLAIGIYHSLQFQRLANIDSLTQVANRRYFQDFLEREWGVAAGKMQYISLILCDVDYFKQYNDTYGHQEGDKCLQKVAKAISYVARQGDLVSRYGGEEFALILPNTNSEVACQIAAKISRIVKSLEIHHRNSKVSNYVTISCGVASIIPDFRTSSSELIASADKALYEAKKQGRDRVNLVII